MTFRFNRLVGAIACVAIALLFSSQDAAAQSAHYFYPASNSGWNYSQRPTARYYSAPRSTGYRSSGYRSSSRPFGGYGSNLHRNFTIRQEQLRSQRTGQQPRNRGNLRWVR